MNKKGDKIRVDSKAGRSLQKIKNGVNNGTDPPVPGLRETVRGNDQRIR